MLSYPWKKKVVAVFIVLIIKAFAWRQSKNTDVVGFQKVYYELSENSISYELTVSETAYEKIQRRLQFFI